MSTSVALGLSQSLFTNGARAAAVLFTKACYFLAIPQLAQDIPGSEAGVNNGNSNVSLMLYRTDEGSSQFYEYQKLDVHGGEDAEFFTIDDRLFLATASMRSGSYPDYNMDVESCIFEWDGDKMAKSQCIPTLGAKQWRYFELDGRHFLALAQGVPDVETNNTNINSTIFEWDGDEFVSFQTFPSLMGYNWLHFSVDGRNFLAYTDHVESSFIVEWNQEEFVHFQTLDGTGGRAFCFFENNDAAYLAFARIESDSLVYKWDGSSFQQNQNLTGLGGREFTFIEEGGSSYLVLVKFITGSKTDPTTGLDSVVYHVTEDGLQAAIDFPTSGGTDVSTFTVQGETYMIVTESLDEEVRFRQDSHIYRFSSENSPGKATMGSGSKRSPSRLTRRAGYQSPEFLDLFSVYTGGPSSIGYQLRNTTTEALMSNPLIIATSTDMILYPGDGSDPTVINYRLESGGFIELTTMSHGGPAVASLAQMHALDPESDDWRTQAKNLRNKTQVAKGANSESLWKDLVNVEAFEGREADIAAMVNYACDLTIRMVDSALADPTKLTPEFVRENFLEATGDGLNADIPYNAVMISTFFLVGMDTAYRVQKWLNQYDIDWTKAMVLVTGQQGRETAGVTISSNTVAQIFLKSFPNLPIERLYIAPHGPAPNVTGATTEDLLQYESEFRLLWGGSSGVAQLGQAMFSGYPAYKVAENILPVINSTTTSLSELPAISSPDDWLALTTRIRVVLEDVRQLLSGCVTDYAAQQLQEGEFNVSRVNVPGLDGYDYASASNKLFSN